MLLSCTLADGDLQVLIKFSPSDPYSEHAYVHQTHSGSRLWQYMPSLAPSSHNLGGVLQHLLSRVVAVV